MGSAFSRYPLRLQEAIASTLGWTRLRPVQELSSHAILDGNNVVILAPTAGGKTEASIFPMLAQLVENEPEGVGLIYVAPIKALLNNQDERLGTYMEMVGLSRFLWHGDVSQRDKRNFVKQPTTLLMTTPESLEVMLLSPKVPVANLFRDLRALIIDEVHALAGSDRGSHLLSVFERLIRHTTNDVQRVGLSATVGNPTDILQWMQGTSNRPNCVVNPPKVPSQKDIHVFLCETIPDIARDASKIAQAKKSLFFCQSRALAESIAERMQDRGTDVFVHHSSVSAEERQAAEASFHQGSNTCIVCTSTLELGIDVGDLDLVLQANAPSTVSSFLQRLGRTGRRTGARANTTFYCEHSEAVLEAIALVELAKKGWVESVRVQKRAWPVLVHQLLALTLQFGAISAERCWEQLTRVLDFSGISHTEFDSLIAHLVREDYLVSIGGLLSMGDRAEKVFGRRNFMEIYAVFSSPVLYKVKTAAGRLVGSLEQDFVDKLVVDMSSFLLGGRAWTVSEINHFDRTITAHPAPGGKKPAWGGFSPQLLSFEICQQIAELLRSSEPISYIDSAAKHALSEKRLELGSSLSPKGLNLNVEPGRALWWTFAGGQINHTLRYGLMQFQDWKIISDNFCIRFEAENLSSQAIHDSLKHLKHAEYWNNESTQQFILNQLPNYRLSKFQQAMPDHYAREMISNYLLDLPGALRYLNILLG
jgi:ATP-dependent helicase Lhr and Lhr-like helicase